MVQCWKLLECLISSVTEYECGDPVPLKVGPSSRWGGNLKESILANIDGILTDDCIQFFTGPTVEMRMMFVRGRAVWLVQTHLHTTM